MNNAGCGDLATVEEGENRNIRAEFETKVFGVAKMIRAILPGMRARRHGCIVSIASVGRIVGLPSCGFYAATKFAVEGLSESLAREVEALGIRVLLVDPGPFRTDWVGRSLRQSPKFISDYEGTSGRRHRETAAHSGTQRGDPALAAEAVIKALQSPKPARHLALGRTGVDTVEKELRSRLEEIGHWRSTSVATDLPTP